MRIYIASPYGRRAGASPDQCERNTQTAIEAARILIKKGHVPFVPHLFHYVHTRWNDSPNEDVWLAICLTWVPTCDAILRLPGESKGADIEVLKAWSYGKTIFRSIDEVPTVKGV